jgi:hypothetical protein
MKGSAWIACRPKKCGTRRSPWRVLHPTPGRPGPPSGPPTVWAPTVVRRPVSFSSASCASVGRAVMAPPREAPRIVIVMPARSAQPMARSSKRWRNKAIATATEASVCVAIARPINEKRTAFNTVEMLKWLVVPRAACKATTATSNSITAAVMRPTHWRVRGHSGRWRKTQARVRQ